MVVWGTNPQGGRGGYGPGLSSNDRNGVSYRKKNKVVRGYFCRAYEGLLLPEQFVGKWFEGHCYKIIGT